MRQLEPRSQPAAIDPVELFAERTSFARFLGEIRLVQRYN